MTTDNDQQVAAAGQFNADLLALLHAIHEAETVLLQLPTDADRSAVPFLQDALSRAGHEITGAYYASVALWTSIVRGGKA